MKSIIFLIFMCILLVKCEQKYDDALDNFDISEVLSNKRLLKSYSKCLLDKGPCTPELKKLKEKIPEALSTRCAKCTEKQKSLAKTLVQQVKRNHPDLYDDFVKKYDPKGEYQEAFRDYFQP